MKNLFMAIIALSIIACSKTAIKTASIIIPVVQDVNLYGKWSMDSTRSNGSGVNTTQYSNSQTDDTLVILKTAFSGASAGPMYIYNNWKTFKDSIFLSCEFPYQGNPVNWQYKITSNVLMLSDSETVMISGQPAKFPFINWYHKVK